MSEPASPFPTALEWEPQPQPGVWVIPPPRQRWWLYGLFFVLTMFSTTVVGARMEFNFLHQQPVFSLNDDTLSLFPIGWIAQHPANLLLGLPFSLTLMFILFAHEMGHYLYARHYRVYATLPFFVPFPSLIGTLGAFIRIKSPIPVARRALRHRNRRANCRIHPSLCGLGRRHLALASHRRFHSVGDSTRIPADFPPGGTPAAHRGAALRALAASDRRRGMGWNVRHCAQPVARRPTRRRPHRILHLAAPASLDFDAHGLRARAAWEISLDGLVPLGGDASFDLAASTRPALSRCIRAAPGARTLRSADAGPNLYPRSLHSQLGPRRLARNPRRKPRHAARSPRRHSPLVASQIMSRYSA